MTVVLVLLVPAKTPKTRSSSKPDTRKGAFNVKPRLQNKNSCSTAANGAHVIRGSTSTHLAASLQYLPT